MRTYKVKCDQCDALVINGTPCHETGCPNACFDWFYDDETLECFPKDYADCDSEQHISRTGD